MPASSLRAAKPFKSKTAVPTVIPKARPIAIATGLVDEIPPNVLIVAAVSPTAAPVKRAETPSARIFAPNTLSRFTFASSRISESFLHLLN